MSDVVETLIDLARTSDDSGKEVLLGAIHHIRTQATTIATLRKALEPFAKFAEGRRSLLNEGSDESVFYGGSTGPFLTRGNFRQALAALQGAPIPTLLGKALPVTPTSLHEYHGGGYACVAFFTTEADRDAFMEWVSNVDAARAALQGNSTEKDDWKLVPLEPTQKMLMKVQLKQSAAGYDPQDAEWLREVYRIMVAESTDPRPPPHDEPQPVRPVPQTPKPIEV